MLQIPDEMMEKYVFVSFYCSCLIVIKIISSITLHITHSPSFIIVGKIQFLQHRVDVDRNTLADSNEQSTNE